MTDTNEDARERRHMWVNRQNKRSDVCAHWDTDDDVRAGSRLFQYYVTYEMNE